MPDPDLSWGTEPGGGDEPVGFVTVHFGSQGVSRSPEGDPAGMSLSGGQVFVEADTTSVHRTRVRLGFEVRERLRPGKIRDVSGSPPRRRLFQHLALALVMVSCDPGPPQEAMRCPDFNRRYPSRFRPALTGPGMCGTIGHSRFIVLLYFLRVQRQRARPDA